MDIPDRIQKEICFQPVTEDTLVWDRIFQKLFNISSLEGATCVDSAGVSPLQRRVSARRLGLPCPERPEESDFIIVGAPEGLPQPVSVLRALPGVPSPEFPRVGDFAVRRSIQLIPLLGHVLHRGTIYIAILINTS